MNNFKTKDDPSLFLTYIMHLGPGNRMQLKNCPKSAANPKWRAAFKTLSGTHFGWHWAMVPYKTPLKNFQGSPSATWVVVSINHRSCGYFVKIAWVWDQNLQNGTILGPACHKTEFLPDPWCEPYFTCWTEPCAIRLIFGAQWRNFQPILIKPRALTGTWRFCTRWPLNIQDGCHLLM